MLEIKNAVGVVVLIFLKHNGLCGRLADSNYFYTGINNVHQFSCKRIPVCVHVTCTVVTVQANCEDLLTSIQQMHKKANSFNFLF